MRRDRSQRGGGDAPQEEILLGDARPDAIHHLDPPRDRGRLSATFDRDQMAAEAAADGARDGRLDNRETLTGLRKVASKMGVRLAAVKSAAQRRFNNMLIAYEIARTRLEQAEQRERERRDERTKRERDAEEDDSPRRWGVVVIWIALPLMVVGTFVDAEFFDVSLASYELIGDTARAVIGIGVAVLLTAVGLFVGLKWHAGMEEEDDDKRRALHVLCGGLTLVYGTVLFLLSAAREQGSEAQEAGGAAHISTGWMAAIGVLVFVLGVGVAFVHADADPRRRILKAAAVARAAHMAALTELEVAKEHLLRTVGAVERAAQDTVRWLEEELSLWALLHAVHEDARIAAALEAFPEHTPVPVSAEPELAAAEELARDVLTPMRYQVRSSTLPDWLTSSLLQRLVLEPTGVGGGHNGNGNGNGNGRSSSTHGGWR